MRLEILFYGDATAELYTRISDRIFDDVPPQMKLLNMAIQILVCCLTFKHKKQSICNKTIAA